MHEFDEIEKDDKKLFKFAIKNSNFLLSIKIIISATLFSYIYVTFINFYQNNFLKFFTLSIKFDFLIKICQYFLMSNNCMTKHFDFLFKRTNSNKICENLKYTTNGIEKGEIEFFWEIGRT
jgi:hypothetical protein